jgi:perosamine synthetase
LVQQFEESFAARVGAAHAVAVSSGTAALHLTYLALFQPGDDVIVPAFTFAATATMLLAVGARPVFADVDPETFTLDVQDVARRITPRTKGIAAVHLFGNSCDVGALETLAREKGLRLVWDAAQALGTTHNGVDVGNRRDAVCYSFYPAKAITTGEGGMVATNDRQLADAVRASRSHGTSAKYVHDTLGFNYRLTEFQAAIGMEQLGRLDGYLARRRVNAARMSAAFGQLPGVQSPVEPTYSGHSYNQFCILVDPNIAAMDRDGLATELQARGIETAIHYPRPLHHQPVLLDRTLHLPVSEALCARILALPVHPGLSASQLDHVVHSMSELLCP